MLSHLHLPQKLLAKLYPIFHAAENVLRKPRWASYLPLEWNMPQEDVANEIIHEGKVIEEKKLFNMMYAAL